MSAFRENRALCWCFLMMDFCFALGKVLSIVHSLAGESQDPLRFPATQFEPAIIRAPTLCKSPANGTDNATTDRDEDMKEFEFAFDDEIFEESNCRTVRVQEPYKPKQCDPKVCFKRVVISYFLSLKFRNTKLISYEHGPFMLVYIDLHYYNSNLVNFIKTLRDSVFFPVRVGNEET